MDIKLNYGESGAPTQNPVSDNKSKFTKVKLHKKKKLAVILLVILIGVGSATYFVNSNNKINELKAENAKLQNPQEAQKQEVERVKEKVGQLIELPQGESPTVATVVDASKLKSQNFFAGAENDDKVLLFPEAKKAILYRPSTNKIIEVAPINIGDSNSNN